MSYKSVNRVQESQSLRMRCAACAAVEGEPDPVTWASLNAWQLAAEPGWADAWASALAAGSADPGGDESVITDSQILAAVQKIRMRP